MLLGFFQIQKTCFLGGKTTKIWGKLSYFDQHSTFWLVFKKPHANSAKYLPEFLFSSSFRIKTARSQNCSLILFELKNTSLKKIRGKGFSFRLVEFHFVLNIPKSSQLKSVVWFSEVEIWEVEAFMFKMSYCIWYGYTVSLDFVKIGKPLKKNDEYSIWTYLKVIFKTILKLI